MKFLLLPLLIASPFISSANASLNLTALNAAADASFDGFTAPDIWATAAPGAGQLDSNRWSINADGPLTTTAATFGVDQTGGQGSSTGSESSAGVFAFDVGNGTTALGVQPTGTFWSPGMFTLRLHNATGGMVTGLQVEWMGWVYNDQDRATDMRLFTSADNATYIPAGSGTEVVSPTLADPAPVAWQGSSRAFSLSGLSLVEGADYYLRWGGDDAGGAGSRDELALSNVRITPVPEPESLILFALGGLALIPRRR